MIEFFKKQSLEDGRRAANALLRQLAYLGGGIKGSVTHWRDTSRTFDKSASHAFHAANQHPMGNAGRCIVL